MSTPAHPPPRRRRRILLGLTALVVLIGCWIGGEAILARAGAGLDIGQPPEKADYVLVLPGGSDTRPYVAAALVKAGYAGEVILLKCKVTPDDLLTGHPPSHEIEQRVLRSRGVPADRVRVLETATESTFSDAECLRAFLSVRNGSTALVVTNDYHTRRTRFAFRKVFTTERDKLRFVSAPTDRFRAANWWRHKTGLQAYVGEYLKLAFYTFRYGQGILWMVAAIGVVMTAKILWRRRNAGHQTAGLPC